MGIMGTVPLTTQCESGRIAEGLPQASMCPKIALQMSLTIELEDSAEQRAFNLKRWAKVLADPELALCRTGSRPTGNWRSADGAIFPGIKGRSFVPSGAYSRSS